MNIRWTANNPDGERPALGRTDSPYGMRGKARKSNSPLLANAARGGEPWYQMVLEGGAEVEDVGHLEADSVD